MKTRRIAIVAARYGTGVVGGAEAGLADIGRGLAARGWSVDLLTTCATSHYTWANEFPPGESHEAGMRIVRFPAVTDTDGRDRQRVEAMVARGERPSVREQESWMNDGLRVPELYHHLLDTVDGYRAIVVSPYQAWTTFACGQIAPERTIIRPCLHDEPHARFELFQPLLNGAGGLWFLTDPEADLARNLFEPPATSAVVGEAVPIPDRYDPDGFRARHGLGAEPFILCGGRREGAKGWEAFLESFTRAVRRDVDLRLVTFGAGDVRVAPDIAERVIDLGYLPEAELADAFAAADGYVQPSALESFSRTVMEAWLAGTLVIANAASDVVAWHCARSGAGLLYRDEYELEQCLRLVAEAPKLAAEIASPGRAYVLDNYAPALVADRIEQTLDAWT